MPASRYKTIRRFYEEVRRRFPEIKAMIRRGEEELPTIVVSHIADWLKTLGPNFEPAIVAWVGLDRYEAALSIPAKKWRTRRFFVARASRPCAGYARRSRSETNLRRKPLFRIERLLRLAPRG